MAKTIFVTGGTRSGKSAFAEKLALEFGQPLGYLATAQAHDGEMDERIRRHQERRGKDWQTMEEPLLLPQVLRDYDGAYKAILIDCLTLWLSNLLMLHEYLGARAEERILEDVRILAETLRGMSTPVIIVSNEVGMGIVPESRMGRLFRDLAGQANQIIAAAANEAWLVVSGISVKLK